MPADVAILQEAFGSAIRPDQPVIGEEDHLSFSEMVGPDRLSSHPVTQHVIRQVLKGILPDKANGREPVQADRRIFLCMMNYDGINGLSCRIQVGPGRRQGQFFAN